MSAARGEEPWHRAALADLYQAYWYPLYVFARKIGRQPVDAEDAVQDFFVALNGKARWAEAAAERGKLRTFLLIVLKRHLGMANRRAWAKKRDGGSEHVVIDWAEGEKNDTWRNPRTRTPESISHRRRSHARTDRV